MANKKNILEEVKRINPNIIKDDKIQSFSQQLLDYVENRFNKKYPMIIAKEVRGLNYISDIESQKLLTINTSTIKKIKTVHSNISCSFISEIEDMLNNSVLGFTSKKFDSTKIIVLDEKDENNNQIIVAIRTDKTLATTEVNEITSIYEKNRLFNYMTDCFYSDKTFYCNKKTKHFIKSYEGFQLPKDLTNAFLTVKYKGSFNKSQVENMLKTEKELEKLEKDLDIELESSVEKSKRKEKDKKLDSKELEI